MSSYTVSKVSKKRHSYSSWSPKKPAKQRRLLAARLKNLSETGVIPATNILTYAQSSEIERFVKLEISDIDNAIFTLKMIGNNRP